MDDTARMARCLKITDPRALTLAYKLPLTKQECEWGLLMGKSLSPRTSGSHLGRLSAQGHEAEAGGSFAGRSWVAGGGATGVQQVEAREGAKHPPPSQTLGGGPRPCIIRPRCQESRSRATPASVKQGRSPLVAPSGWSRLLAELEEMGGRVPEGARTCCSAPQSPWCTIWASSRSSMGTLSPMTRSTCTPTPPTSTTWRAPTTWTVTCLPPSTCQPSTRTKRPSRSKQGAQGWCPREAGGGASRRMRKTAPQG